MRNTARPLLMALLVALVGCARMKPGMGFDDVQRAVLDRAGARTHWATGSPEDADVASVVTSMLEQELTADGAVQIALLNNHELQAVYEELNVAQADLVQAGLLRNPVFSAQLRFDTAGGGTGVDLEVVQDFISILSMPLRKGRAGAAFEAAKVRVTAEVLDAAFNARTAFHDYQAAEQVREMRVAVLEATAASYELAERLWSAGNFRDLDFSNERMLHEQSRIDLSAAEAGVVRARERLNERMGLWGAQTRWRAATRLPAIPEEDVPAEGLERRAIEASLDLALLRREVEIAARSARIARPFAWLDDADIGVAAEREVEGGWSVGPAFGFPIPLFDQGQAAVGAAGARYRQAAERMVARAVEIRSRVRAAHGVVAEARDRALYYQGVILPLRQRIVDETQLQYNAMQVGAFQLLQAKRDQINAGAEYIAAVHDYWQERAALDQLLRGRMNAVEQQGMATGLIAAAGAPGATGHGDHR